MSGGAKAKTGEEATGDEEEINGGQCRGRKIGIQI